MNLNVKQGFGFSNQTRGVNVSGNTSNNGSISFFTIASTSNAIDYGDFTLRNW